MMELITPELEHDPLFVSVEVQNDRCRGLKRLHEVGITDFSFDDVRMTPSGAVRHFVRVSPDQPLSPFRREKGESHSLFNCEGCSCVCTCITSNAVKVSCRLIRGSSTFIYSFVAPNYTVFQHIISELERAGYDPIVRKIVRRNASKTLLTRKQERVLWHAYTLGFFQYPRRVNTIDLPKKLGISASTFSEIYRRGIQRILTQHFDGPAI
jgi:predicted DNA binding protein